MPTALALGGPLRLGGYQPVPPDPDGARHPALSAKQTGSMAVVEYRSFVMSCLCYQGGEVKANGLGSQVSQVSSFRFGQVFPSACGGVHFGTASGAGHLGPLSGGFGNGVGELVQSVVKGE